MPASSFWYSIPTQNSHCDPAGLQTARLTEQCELRRIGPFEQVAAGLSSAEIVASGDWLGEPLRSLLSVRVRYWRGYRRPPGRFMIHLIRPFSTLAASLNWPWDGSIRLPSVTSLVATGVWLSILYAIVLDWTTSLILTLMWAAVIFAEVCRRKTPRRITQALVHGICGDCGYQLLQPSQLTRGICHCLPGPRQCPECGTMWPLIPPPIPSE